ncbi:MAG TPA: VCBS repeat-containing protein, partial [Polyangiaceae bacterium]|nr:VCBS repeat-containing protein [Polyangiaceae bacterium]
MPALLFALGACVDLQPIEGDTCGNGVVEGGEDCDFAEPGCRRPPAAGACRYECVHPSVGQGAGCPEGFGCGVDNTCRRSAGTFALTIERLSEGASALRVADFDGDGRDDVLALGAPNTYAERSARVVFRDGGGFGPTTRLPNVFRAAAVGSLVPGLGPARGLALVSRQGAQAALNLLVGGPDRGFASVVSPALASAALPASMRLVGVEALPRRAVAGEGGATVEFNQGDEVVLLQPGLLGQGAGLFGLVSSPRELPPNASNPDPDVVALLTLGVSPVDAEGGVAVGRFSAPGVGAPCEDIVWAPRELAEAYLLSPCRVDAPSGAPPGAGAVAFWNEEGIAGRVEPRRVPLPEGALPAKGAARWAFVADANADGVSDLAVMTERGAAFAAGRPDGSAPQAVLVDPVAGSERKLLAFGELNGDGAPDWVFADGIVLSEAGLPAGVTRERSAAPWSEALVADFNGDGLSDVLAVGPASSSLDYYLDTPGGFFNALSVPVAGVPSRLAAGDFDGDGVADVAFAMVDEVADGVEVDAVFIAFGGKAALPAAPVRVGALSGVRQITAGSYVFGGSGLDGADDLG